VRRFVLCALALAALVSLSGCGSPAETKARADEPSKATTAVTGPRAKAPVVMVLGDSYTAGLPDVLPEQTFAADTARRLKWQLIIAGHYGTGFVAPGRIGKTFATLFHEQLAWRPAPDMIIVSGGHNDWAYTYEQVSAAARQLLADVKNRWPDTRIVLMGPLWGSDPPPRGLQVRDALEEAATEQRVAFVDPLAEQWINGDIRSGIGNASKYIRADGTHPNAEGNRYFADRFIIDLRRLGLTRPRLKS
jgi:lysophospholipase L1-like esterase